MTTQATASQTTNAKHGLTDAVMGVLKTPTGQIFLMTFAIAGAGLLWVILQVQAQLSVETTAAIVTPIGLFLGFILPFPSVRVLKEKKSRKTSRPIRRRPPF